MASTLDPANSSTLTTSTTTTTTTNPPQQSPLYNTTFTLHRVSPLYTSDRPLTPASLRTYARRFRDILVGDVLRGVRVGLGTGDGGLGDEVLARVGSLKEVRFAVLERMEKDGASLDWMEVDDEDLGSGMAVLEDGNGILIRVVYEHAIYMAMLLRTSAGGRMDGFESFPLLLSRMPGTLRATLISFLTSSFDCRISELQISGNALGNILETYLDDLSRGNQADGPAEAVRTVIRDLQLAVAFDLPPSKSNTTTAATPLKTLDIQIGKDDLAMLTAKGRRPGLPRPSTAGDGDARDTPLLDALAVHLKQHLALDFKHERIKLIKVACAAFVLGAEGKAKLTYPVEAGGEAQVRATAGLVDELIRIAHGGNKLSSG